MLPKTPGEEAMFSVRFMEFDLRESDSLCCLAAPVNLRHTYLFISNLVVLVNVCV